MYLTTSQKREFLNLDESLSQRTLNIIAKNTQDNTELVITNIRDLKKVNITVLVCNMMFMIFFTYMYFLLEKDKYIYLPIFTTTLFFMGVCLTTYALSGFNIYYPKLNKLIRMNFVNKDAIDISIDVIYNYEIINIKNYTTYIYIKRLTGLSWLTFLIVLTINIIYVILY